LKLRKIHKAEKAVVFIEKCLEHVVQPKCCQLPNALKEIVGASSNLLRKNKLFLKLKYLL
jgi:hypothetical protein